MISLILSVISSVIIASLISHTGKKNIPVIPLMAVNYVFAAVISFFLYLKLENHEVMSSDFFLGCLNAVFFSYGFLSYFRGVQKSGISLSVAVMRLAVAVPVFSGFLFYQEKLGFNRCTGLFLMLCVILKMFRQGKNAGGIDPSLIILFLSVGLSDVVTRAFVSTGSQNRNLFLAFIYSGAFMICLCHMITGKMRIDRRTVFYGLMVAVPNQASSLFLLSALKTIDSVIVFPAAASGVLILSALTDIFIWKQPLDSNRAWILILATGAVIFLNL